jgi:hypothetical protein
MLILGSDFSQSESMSFIFQLHIRCARHEIITQKPITSLPRKRFFGLLGREAGKLNSAVVLSVA